MNKRQIEAAAENILRDHRMLQLRVDPVDLANRLGVRVYNAKFGEGQIAGLIAIRGANTAIYVNADDPPRRKRFTIAHELGHFFLHGSHVPDGGEFVDTADTFRTPQDPSDPWTPERRMEWEANTFAAALLMPRQMVEEKWRELGKVEAMADWFQVSVSAMAIRLGELGLL